MHDSAPNELRVQLAYKPAEAHRSRTGILISERDNLSDHLQESRKF